MNEPRQQNQMLPTWALSALAGGAVALLAWVMTSQRSEGRESGQTQIAVAEVARRMDEGFALVRRDIDRNDKNSEERRLDSREYTNTLHQQQQRELEEIKLEIRRRHGDAPSGR